jgi:HK97 family phage portal protein
MRLRLPFVGRVRTGKDAVEAPQIVNLEPPRVSASEFQDEEKFLNTLGGFLQFSRSSLSDERTISSKLLEANKEWVYRNNDVIAQEVSHIEFELYTVGMKGGEIDFTEVEEHPLLDLLDKFNPTMTRSDGIYITQSHKKLTGDAFWLLQRDGPVIKEIYPLPPDKIEILLNEAKNPGNDRAKLIRGYLYKDRINGKDIEITYSTEDIIHFKKPNPKNPFRGIGVVEALAETIDVDNLTNATQRSFFDKGALSNFVLTTDSKLTQDQLKRIKAELRAAYTGVKNAWTTMIFGNGLKPASIGFSNKEMEFLDLLEWFRDKIMICFGNTKASIGIIDDVNRASFNGSYAAWLRSSVHPDMMSIVNTLNEFLVPMFDERLVLGFKNPVPDDRTDDLTEAVMLKNAGIIMVNEAREKLDYVPVDGGDIFAPLSAGTLAPQGPDNEQAPGTVQPGQGGPQDQQGDPGTEDEPKTPEGTPPEGGQKTVRIYRRAKGDPRFRHVPPSLAHMDVKQILRKRKMFTIQRVNRDLKESAKPLIRDMLNGKQRRKLVVKRVHSQFSNEQITQYYEKQIHIVEVVEKQFHDTVVQFIGKLESRVLDNLGSEVRSIRGLKAYAKKEMWNETEMQIQAQFDFYPLLLNELVLAGQAAFTLIDSTDTYIPYNIQEQVRTNINLFTKSMLETDRSRLAQIIADGIKAGAGVPEIRQTITNAFQDIKKVQAERITRTEVLRVASQAAEDSFIQSGVVEAKQWLAAPDCCAICRELDGKIVGLRQKFYEPEDEFENGRPPKHVNCRCQMVPIVRGTRAVNPGDEVEKEKLRRQIRTLEAQVDKRTKEFKQLKAESADDKVYIQALSKHLGLVEEEVDEEPEA